MFAWRNAVRSIGIFSRDLKLVQDWPCGSARGVLYSGQGSLSLAIFDRVTTMLVQFSRQNLQLVLTAETYRRSGPDGLGRSALADGFTSHFLQTPRLRNHSTE